MRKFLFYAAGLVCGAALTATYYNRQAPNPVPASREGLERGEVLVSYPSHTGVHPGTGEYTVFKTVRLVPRKTGESGAVWTISDADGDRRYKPTE